LSTIVPIIEGHAEVESVPVLLRRLLEQLNAAHLNVCRPFRVKRNRIVQEAEIERAVQQAERDREGVTAILIFLDADDDPPEQLAADLLRRARNVTRLPVAVALAVREFEAWFLGAKESLRGVRGIRTDAANPPDPESIRGAKERLSKNMPKSRRYLEVDDQPALAARMDLDMARRNCRSFDKFCRDVQSLVAAALQG
jgi:hypothetical protein